MRRSPPCRVASLAGAATLIALCLLAISTNARPAPRPLPFAGARRSWQPPLRLLPGGFTPLLPAPQTEPRLECTPNLAFGIVSVGTRKVMMISCTNTGTANVTLGYVTVSGEGFSIESQFPVQPAGLQMLTAQKGVPK